MRRKFFAAIPALLVIALVLSMPTSASAPTGHGSAKPATVVDQFAPPAPSQIKPLREATQAELNELNQNSPASWCKLYWRVNAYSCVCGSRIDLWIGGTYMGYVTKTGTYYVGKAVNGYKYKFYARDSGYCTYWSKKYYINYTKFTWTIYC